MDGWLVGWDLNKHEYRHTIPKPYDVIW